MPVTSVLSSYGALCVF